MGVAEAGVGPGVVGAGGGAGPTHTRLDGLPEVHCPEQQSTPLLQDSPTPANEHASVGEGVGSFEGALEGALVGGIVGDMMGLVDGCPVGD